MAKVNIVLGADATAKLTGKASVVVTGFDKPNGLIYAGSGNVLVAIEAPVSAFEYIRAGQSLELVKTDLGLSVAYHKAETPQPEVRKSNPSAASMRHRFPG